MIVVAPSVLRCWWPVWLERRQQPVPLMLNLELVATVVLAALVFGEHLGARVLAGSALILAAGVLLVWQPGAADRRCAVGGRACLCWGIDNNLTAHLDQIAPEHISFLKGAVAGTANLDRARRLAGLDRPCDAGGRAGHRCVRLRRADHVVGAQPAISARRGSGLRRRRSSVPWSRVLLGDPASVTQVLAMGWPLSECGCPWIRPPARARARAHNPRP
ncbi:MAG: hypothetical protein R2726_13540 [Acidimicrobiales bacterium]